MDAGVIVYAKIQSDSALSRWLLSGQEAPAVGRRDWDVGRHALLRTGLTFDAIRVREQLVHAAVGTAQPDKVGGALAKILDGPVIHDPAAWYYALVPAGTAETWHSPLATAKGLNCWLAVPRVDRIEPIGVHWAVPPESVGRLCEVEAVDALLRTGQARRIEQGAHR